MKSNVDKILKNFNKTVTNLIYESDRLIKESARKNAEANNLLNESESLSREGLRAQKVADKLLEIISA